MSELTPMMQQYINIKQEYIDAILMFRMGDFYEMFMDDAEIASRELDIVLTAREGGKGKKVPMAGVPYHAAENYIAKLIEKGYKVAICEQVEDPKTVKGLVKREVVRVVTPGTALDQTILDEKKNNYLIAIYQFNRNYGFAVSDHSTGEFYINQFSGEKAELSLINELNLWQPVECLWNEEFDKNRLSISVKSQFNPMITVVNIEEHKLEQFLSMIDKRITEKDFDIIKSKNYNLARQAAGLLISYLYKTQKSDLKHISTISLFNSDQHMLLDASTFKNLELTKTISNHKKQGSLLSVLDQTITAMGSRLLVNWLERPLIDLDLIQCRLDSVEIFYNNGLTRKKLQQYMKNVYDLERLISRIVLERANPKDLLALKKSIQIIPSIKKELTPLAGEFIQALNNGMDSLDDIVFQIDQSIVDNPPFTLKDGGIIKDNYNEELDRLREASTSGRKWLAELEADEKGKTGIKSLKIAYNKVFGYYIEITKANLDLVPTRYERKQTLANAERFVTKELKEIETLILTAENKINEIEYQLFQNIREKVANEVARIQKTARNIAALDVIVSLAECAVVNRYVKPRVNLTDRINIRDGRHPVVEKAETVDNFIPNDCMLDCDSNQIMVITGPNMAGKSTFMRQVALIVLMSQIGSYVPAIEATIGIVDRIFTRVGASDDLSSGQSTFMLEMNEVASILKSATKRSLLILDEIGRGTSTFDGISIAWAVAEHIHNHPSLGSKTLFATHYHELTEMAKFLNRVKNYSVSVVEKGEDIIFLRKIISGGSDRSYGIHVARLAGLPNTVIKKANEILIGLENFSLNTDEKSLRSHQTQSALSKETYLDSKIEELKNQLKEIDINHLTPMEALNKLYELKERFNHYLEDTNGEGDNIA